MSDGFRQLLSPHLSIQCRFWWRWLCLTASVPENPDFILASLSDDDSLFILTDRIQRRLKGPRTQGGFSVSATAQRCSTVPLVMKVAKGVLFF